MLSMLSTMLIWIVGLRRFEMDLFIDVLGLRTPAADL